METIINGDVVEVVKVIKNNKNIYLRFKEDKKLYVTCSARVSDAQITKLIDANKNKITKMYEEVLKNVNNDLFFNYLGKKYTIILDDTIKNTYLDDCFVYAKNKKELDKFYKNEVLRVFSAEVERISPYFDNIPSFTLKIRNMKTRWGVCNTKDNIITLNSELLKKDIDLLDYVIIHELCHFYEANHSSKFWSHVSKYYPDYKGARKRLRS
jgi:hypothetical protein